jgi:hypothetical protein
MRRSELDPTARLSLGASVGYYDSREAISCLAALMREARTEQDLLVAVEGLGSCTGASSTIRQRVDLLVGSLSGSATVRARVLLGLMNVVQCADALKVAAFETSDQRNATIDAIDSLLRDATAKNAALAMRLRRFRDHLMK